MRSSLSLKALALAAAALEGVHSFDMVKLKRIAEMAEIGLYPDGTPMHSPDIMALNSRAPAAAEPENIVTEYIELPLNHFGTNGSSDGTYLNRFWVSTDAYKPGAPIFVYDAGEDNAEYSVATKLGRTGNFTNVFRSMVDKYQGIGIVWEHRYYGNSTPGNVPISADTKPEVFQWLTTEQSLKDLVVFAGQFSRPNISNLTPDKTPWIMFGGSYPGMRTAFMRHLYPETIFAGYSSSAPTEAKVDMSSYFEPIAKGLTSSGAGNCSKDIHAAIGYIDQELDKDGETAANLKVQFLGGGADKNSHGAFAEALASIFYLWQSYGIGGSPWSLAQFCDYLETDPASNNTVAGPDGWAASKGAKFVVDRWASWPKFAGIAGDFGNTVCSGNANVTAECELDFLYTDPSSVSWRWQYCTQWGFFQTANLGPNQIVSKYNSLEYQQDTCHRQFPNATSFPDWPQADKANTVFGGWNIRPSQLYWSAGEFDPWRSLSPFSEEPGAPHPKPFTDPPKCGEGQPVEEILGYVLPDSEHVSDFNPTRASSQKSLGYFFTALDGWLKCFQPPRNE